MKSPAIEFDGAVAAFRAGNFRDAKRICNKVLKRQKNHGDAAHILALIHKQDGDFLNARKYYLLSLKSNPKQPAVLSNFANLLMQYEHHAQAHKYFAKAVELAPDHIDAWHNWAVLLNRLERYEEAAEKIGVAITLDPTQARFYVVLGDARRELEDFDSALTAFDKAISLALPSSKDHLLAIQQKATTYRSMQKPELAVACLQGVGGGGQQNADLAFALACSHYDTDEFGQAEQSLQRAIALNPLHIPAHEALNKLYWEQSQDEKFLVSYREACSGHPAAVQLSYSYASQLILSDQHELAQKVLLRALKANSLDATLLHGLAVSSKRLGRDEESENYLNRAIKLQPDALRFRIDKANVLLQQKQYKAALKQLDVAGKRDPLNQEVWAYRGLCWRLLGDERSQWLNNYDLLVDEQELSVPDGYDDLEHFMQALQNAVSTRHKTHRQPLDQSVNNGSQTVGKLLAVQDKVIQDYRRVLSASIRAYLARLPHDPTHPFLNRNVQDFVHTGSWSVKLKSGGYHSNHMHPQGWLSNCSYVALPDAIKPTDGERAGWIKFGETSLDLDELELIEKAVCPKRGVRVLFPSYFWHGTIPFSSDQFRITLPSDISPKLGAA